MDGRDVLSSAVIRLFESERFYAELVISMQRVFTKDVPIAGVCIRSNVELHINPMTFSKLSALEQVAVLKHECEHLLRDHISRSKALSPETYKDKKDMAENIVAKFQHQAINIAADMAINGHITNLPEGAVYPKTFDLEDGETMEWYLGQLKQNEKAKGFMNFDDHALWGESEGSAEMLAEKVRSAVNKAAEKAKAAGNLSSELELLISQLNPPSVDWRAQLRRFVARATDLKIESSKKKRNRRYGIMYPGEIKTETLYLGVAMDTSGSVSDEALKQFMSEINYISKYANIKVVEADAEIKNSYVYDPKKTYAIKGRGGTAYRPVFDFFNAEKIKIDGLIYFGDMDCFDQEKLEKPNYSVLWAIVGNQKPPASFGHSIQVKE